MYPPPSPAAPVVDLPPAQALFAIVFLSVFCVGFLVAGLMWTFYAEAEAKKPAGPAPVFKK
jgi:hypothetical protein